MIGPGSLLSDYTVCEWGTLPPTSKFPGGVLGQFKGLREGLYENNFI